MSQQTPLHSQHQALGAKLVDFAGWDMPIHYTSQIQEHHAVRQNVGMFDVSHMGVIDVIGSGAYDFLRYVCANDIAKLTEAGRALYSCILNEQGGVIDDLIVYRVTDRDYRIVLNAGRRAVDMAWLQQQAAQFDVTVTERMDVGIIAVQGPNALATIAKLLQLPELLTLPPFRVINSGSLQIATTGYTGEAGVEIIVPANELVDLWQRLLAEGVIPCGLGARDTLRLEAGYNLYGSDMNENTSPLISNLAWTISFKDTTRQFIGRAALEAEQAAGIEQELVALVMEDKGVLRDHQAVYEGDTVVGEITSGSFSPTLGCAIALARVQKSALNQALNVDRRGSRLPVRVAKPGLVKLGKKV